METILDSSVAIPPQVVSRDVSGETVLLDLASGTYFGLDEVGTRMWTLLGEGKTLAVVAAAVAEEYAADERQVATDTVNFVTQLADKGLVEVRATGSADD